MKRRFAVAPEETAMLGASLTLVGAKKRDETRQKWAGRRVLIHSREHNAFWRARGAGYTSYLAAAGIYTFEYAYQCTKHCDPSKGIVFFAAPRWLRPLDPSEAA